MKIRALRLEQFKKFDQPVAIEGFDDGLNLIAGPNETGKSTLLLALRAALFERHGSRAQAVRDFSPRHVHGARPTVTLDFEIDNQRYVLEKSFLSRAMASLETSDGTRFQGTDAETELKRLLHLTPSEKTSADKDSPAHFGVLLTPQTRSFHQPAIEDGTRHSLEAAIAEDIAELGNQGEVDGLLAEIDTMLDIIVYKRGEPKNRYKDVIARLDEVERETAEATQERGALQDQLNELERAIDRRNDLTASESRDRLSDCLASMEASRAKAMRRQALENRCLAARQELQRLEAKRAERRDRKDKWQRITDELTEIETEAEMTCKKLDSIERTLAEQETVLAELDEKLGEHARRQRALDRLGQQIERRRHVEATLTALATDVCLDLQADALDRVTVDGEPPSAVNDHHQVTEGLLITIEGIGEIVVEPKIEPLQEALAAKDDADAAIAGLLESLDLADAESEAIDVAWQSTMAELGAIEASRAAHETAMADQRRLAAEAKALLKTSGDRQARLSRALTENKAVGDDGNEFDLDAEIAAAKRAVDDADQDLRAAPPNHPSSADEAPGAGLDARIEELRQQIEERRRSIEEANNVVVRLESAISVRTGLGLDERIDQLDRQRHLLAKERDALALDHEALTLLRSKLRETADVAKATFNAPLVKRLTPYVQRLLPEATPLVTPGFSIRALDRNGLEEPFHHLSDGTREQIAILARLAFADMLKEQGLPALIVLDDALAFSDNERLGRMFGILQEAAKQMQIIILTCRDDLFASLKATRLHITSASERTSSAA